ncbi:MAG TPA: IPT/TIG domain-containing protein, partial [Thermoanaerobaculia bacterium]
IVLTQAGTASEARAELTGAFTFRSEQLTPIISTVTPNSGPVTGGTRVSIFGEGFQEPVQVLFDTAEARVLNVKFNEILVETPAGRDTSPTGEGPVVGPVGVTVRNINSNQAVTIASGFLYKNAIQIIAVSPGGAIAGVAGTRVTIDGNGFVSPVVVVVRTPEGDVSLQPISVTGTKIVAIAPAILPSECADLIGPLIITNVVNGDQAEGPPFTFFVAEPVIVGISPSTVVAGQNITVTVANASPGGSRLTIGDRNVFPTLTSFDETTRVATFTIATPTDIDFPTVACTVGGVPGERQTSVRFDVGYENVATTCEDTATQALTITPLDATCVLPPPPNANITPAVGTCGNMGNVPFAGTVTGTATFTITNTGGSPLIVSSVAVVGSANTTTVTATPTSATIAPQASQTFTVTADPAAAGAFGGTVRANSNDPDTPALDFCFTGNGT